MDLEAGARTRNIRSEERGFCVDVECFGDAASVVGFEWAPVQACSCPNHHLAKKIQRHLANKWVMIWPMIFFLPKQCRACGPGMRERAHKISENGKYRLKTGAKPASVAPFLRCLVLFRVK